MTRRRTLAGLVALGAVLVGAPVAAGEAAGPVSLAVSGGPGEVVVAPGEQGHTSFTVRNPAAYAQRVEIDLTGLAVRDGAYDFSGTPTWDLEVTVSPDRLLLEGGGAQQIVVGVRPPADTAVGGLYAGVIVRGIPEAPPGQAPVVGEIGLPLLVRVPGVTDDTGRIASFRPQRASYRSGPVSFVVAFENTGEVHYSPSGTVELFSGRRSLGTVAVNPQVVLPGTTRRLIAAWRGEAPTGELSARLALSWGLDGRHHATREAVATIALADTSPERAGRDILPVVAVGAAVSGLALAILLLLFALVRLRGRKREGAASETGIRGVLAR